MALFTANGSEVKCSTGDSVRVPSATILCDAVGDDSVDLTVNAR